MLEHMQGISSHAFAALMTFTVLTFPTPSDMIEAFSPRDLAEEKAIEIGQFPTIVAYEPPVNNLLASDDLFPVVAACMTDEDASNRIVTPECQAALDRLADATGIPPSIERIAYDAEALTLAGAYFCRAQWAEAMRNGSAFDVSGCVRAHQVVENAVN